MLQRRGVIGLIFGIVALALGVAAWAGAGNDGILALFAGLLGLGAGAAALISEFQTDKTSGLVAAAERQAQEATAQLQRTEDAISHERKMRTKAEDNAARLQALLDAKEVAALTAPTTDASIDAASSPESTVRALTDPVTNLFSEAYFRVALDSRIASARRHLRPVAIGLLDVVEGVQNETPHPADPMTITACIRQTLRDADTACRLSDGSYALILEDTPENGAVWTVERIRRALTSQFPDMTLWAGIACYPAHAFSTDELLDASRLALTSAREWKQDRIEVATAE